VGGLWVYKDCPGTKGGGGLFNRRVLGGKWRGDLGERFYYLKRLKADSGLKNATQTCLREERSTTEKGLGFYAPKTESSNLKIKKEV